MKLALISILLIASSNLFAFKSYTFKSLSSLQNFEKTAWKTKSVKLKHWKLWQASLNFTIFNRPKKSIKLQKYLLQNNSAIDINKLQLALGRNYYQSSLFQKSIERYAQVTKSSPDWVQAKEELAWSYLRQKKFGSAKSEIKTLLSPIFKTKISIETYLLSGVTSLKTCDYNSIFKIVKLFKKRTREQLVLLEKNKTRASKRKIKNFEKVLNSMQILEAEAIQRLHGLKQAKEAENKFEKIESNDYLVFPYDGDESWVDEIDNYQVKSNFCNSTKRNI